MSERDAVMLAHACTDGTSRAGGLLLRSMCVCDVLSAPHAYACLAITGRAWWPAVHLDNMVKHYSTRRGRALTYTLKSADIERRS
jgi:hypothetical protein